MEDFSTPFAPPTSFGRLPTSDSQSSSSFSSSTFLTSSTGTKIPNPGLHRNNRSPSYFPSHSLVALFSSSLRPTTTPPPANSAGPTNMTVPFRPPTSARSPMYTLFAFGLSVAMSSCFCKRARRSNPASESFNTGRASLDGKREGTIGTRVTAGGTCAGAFLGCAGAARPGAPPRAGGSPRRISASGRPPNGPRPHAPGPAFSFVTGAPPRAPIRFLSAGGGSAGVLCCAARAPSAASFACLVATRAAAAAAAAAAAFGFAPRPRHTFSCSSFCPRSNSSWHTPHFTSSHGLLLSRWCSLNLSSGNFWLHCRQRNHLTGLGTSSQTSPAGFMGVRARSMGISTVGCDA
mmetsp:Transcript_13354/g.56092  ORF Transcript_13354/g.56092 Transcript_13354/m.56092 type:complete len:348 (-) Transcript_13354:6-1049(-)